MKKLAYSPLKKIFYYEHQEFINFSIVGKTFTEFFKNCELDAVESLYLKLNQVVPCECDTVLGTSCLSKFFKDLNIHNLKILTVVRNLNLPKSYHEFAAKQKQLERYLLMMCECESEQQEISRQDRIQIYQSLCNLSTMITTINHYDFFTDSSGLDFLNIIDLLFSIVPAQKMVSIISIT